MSTGQEHKRARSLALRYLSYRDRSFHEVSAHLAQKGVSPKAIRETLDRLAESGLLNDERFARNWARSRISVKKLGPIRLRRELLAKGVEDSIVQSALGELYSERDPKDLARTCARKKISALTGVEPEQRKRRLVQYLQRKGFSPETVYQTVADLLAGRDGMTGDRDDRFSMETTEHPHPSSESMDS